VSNVAPDLQMMRCRWLGFLALVVLAAPAAGRATEAATDARAESTMGIAKISSVPQAARVSIDGQVVGETPLTRYLPVGHHVLRVETDHYDPFVRRIDVSPDTTLEVRAELAPGGNTIEFSVEPAGATVVLNDDEEWPAPVRLSRAPGHYSYRLTAPGYAPQRGEIDFDDGENVFVQARLLAADGLVTITSEPVGARVRLGDEVLGTTPLTVQGITKGPHTFLFDLPGHALATGHVDTTDGMSATVDAFLTKNGVPVSVDTGEPTAEVRVEGVQVGTGEIVTFRVAHHTPYHLLVEAQGFDPSATTLSVAPGTSKVTLRAELKTSGHSTLKEVKPLTKKRSFWVATGAAVVVASAATFAALSSGGPEAIPPGDATVPFP
jgi:hypothetical protein